MMQNIFWQMDYKIIKFLFFFFFIASRAGLYNNSEKQLLVEITRTSEESLKDTDSNFAPA